jgi:hypothetical protein
MPSNNNKPSNLISFNMQADYLKVAKKYIELKPYTEFGVLNLDIENHHNKSILTLNYLPSDYAKKNGMKPITVTNKITLNGLPDDAKKSARHFLHNLDKSVNNTNTEIKEYDFFYTAVSQVTQNMTNNLMYYSLKNSYTSLHLNSSAFTASTISPGSTSSSSSWVSGSIFSKLLNTILDWFQETILVIWEPILETLQEFLEEIFGVCKNSLGNDTWCRYYQSINCIDDKKTPDACKLSKKISDFVSSFAQKIEELWNALQNKNINVSLELLMALAVYVNIKEKTL